MSQKCKLYPQDLITVFESHSKMSHFWWVSNTVVCLARYVYKKVSWKSFIINLWKQRLVFAFFCFFFPVGSDLLVLANICLALRNVTILWQGKVAYNWHDACLHLLFWNVGRRRDDDDAFLHCCKRAWMTHFMRKICIWIMIFFQIKKKSLALPKSQFSLVFSRQHIVWKLLKVSHLNFVIFHQFLSYFKTDLSGNTVWQQASGFQILAQMDHFWSFFK